MRSISDGDTVRHVAMTEDWVLAYVMGFISEHSEKQDVLAYHEDHFMPCRWGSAECIGGGTQLILFRNNVGWEFKS